MKRLAPLILSRRLLGMDKDIIGESVHCNGGAQTLLQKLLPQRGVGFGESSSEASLLIDFSSSAKQAAQHMLERKSGGLTVSVIDVQTPEKAGKILDQISKVVDVELAAFVDEGAGGPYLLVSSHPTSKPHGEFEMKIFNEPGELWTFASVTVTTRSHAIEAVKSGLSNSADLTAAAAYVTQNALQIPYASASKSAAPTLYVPKELKESTNRALDRLVSTLDDVDQFVAEAFGVSKNELGNCFSPEQLTVSHLPCSTNDAAALP